MKDTITYKINMEEPVEVKGIKKFVGLIGCMDEHTKPLLFKFKKLSRMPIHSYFVYINFVAEWTFEDGTTQVMLVTPFLQGIKPLKPYIQLIERPLILQQEDNDNNKSSDNPPK